MNNREQNLNIRSSIIACIRKFFVGSGFVEVDTPAIQVSSGGDRHARGLMIDMHRDLSEEPITRYLQTSPEFSMKKLLAKGYAKIFQICHVFRNGEVGPFHHPEFTLLEWYREGADYQDIMKDTEDLVSTITHNIPPKTAGFYGASDNARKVWNRLSVVDAFSRYANINILSMFSEDGTLDTVRFKCEAARSGVYCSDNDHWDDIFYRVVLEKIEPKLVGRPPTFFIDFPLPVGALAKRNHLNRKICERTELYVCGLEIGNGFSELCDPAEQLERFRIDHEYITKVYGTAPPIDYELIDSLQSLESAAGMALGVDRLIMLISGAKDIKEVLWLPLDLR